MKFTILFGKGKSNLLKIDSNFCNFFSNYESVLNFPKFILKFKKLYYNIQLHYTEKPEFTIFAKLLYVSI